MELILTVLSGVGWVIVYEECIRLGFSQKTYAMPFFALGLNFAWELIYTLSDIFLKAHGPLVGMNLVQAIANAAWVCLDVLILTTYFRYGRKEWPRSISQTLFLPWSILSLLCCFALQLVFIAEFGFLMAAQYSAFLQNLLMSVLFLAMYAKRGGMEGQSVLLAVAKWIGTLAPTILMGVMTYNIVVLVCGIFCSIFDLIYIALLMKEKSEPVEPARRDDQKIGMGIEWLQYPCRFSADFICRPGDPPHQFPKISFFQSVSFPVTASSQLNSIVHADGKPRLAILSMLSARSRPRRHEMPSSKTLSGQSLPTLLPMPFS